MTQLSKGARKSALAAIVATAALVACGDGATGHEERFVGAYEGTFTGWAGGPVTAMIHDYGLSTLMFSVDDPGRLRTCSQLHLRPTGPTRATLGPESNCGDSDAVSADAELDGDRLSITWTVRFTVAGGESETLTHGFEGVRVVGDGTDPTDGG